MKKTMSVSQKPGVKNHIFSTRIIHHQFIKVTTLVNNTF